MNAAKKQSARRELENIEAALEETILACTPSELRHDLVANGDDVDAVLKEIEDVVCGAISQCAKQNLVKAKHELSEWRIARSGRSMTDDTQNVAKTNEAPRTCSCHPSDVYFPCQREHAFTHCERSFLKSQVTKLREALEEALGYFVKVHDALPWDHFIKPEVKTGIAKCESALSASPLPIGEKK